jgi:hypothetical protein
MAHWSKPFKETDSFTTEDGRKYEVTRTYRDLISSRPFGKPEQCTVVLNRQLTDIDVSGDLTEAEAKKVLDTLVKIWFHTPRQWEPAWAWMP